MVNIGFLLTPPHVLGRDCMEYIHNPFSGSLNIGAMVKINIDHTLDAQE